MAHSSAPPGWGRQWSPQQQNGDYVVMDPRVMHYEQHAAPPPASLPRSMMAPSYMMNQSYSQGPMTNIPAPQYQNQAPPMAYGSYTSSPTSLISPFHEQLRFPSADSDHSPVTSHPDTSRSGSVSSSRTMSSTSDGQPLKQNAKPTTTKSVPGIFKTVAPIVTEEPSIEADTCVDMLLRVIQAKPETDAIVAKVEEGIKQEYESTVKMEEVSPSSSEQLPEDSSKQARKKEKKFFCHFRGCTAGFAQRPHLTIHLRSHNGERPFACRYCPKRFSQTGNRKSHETTHTKEKPFPCELGCGKWFRQRSTAKQHLKTHSGIREFTCKLCESEKLFALRGNLKTHLQAFHQEEVMQWLAKFKSASFDSLPEAERDLFVYFATIFKNCNKGIKGRGKNKDKIRDQQAMHTPPATNSSCSSSSGSPVTMHAPGPMQLPHYESQHQHHIQLPVINTNGQHHHQLPSPVHHHDAHGAFQHHHHTHQSPTHGLPSVYSMGLPPPLVTSIPVTTMAYDMHSAGSTAPPSGDFAFGDRVYH